MTDFSPYEKMPKSLNKSGFNERDYAKFDKLTWVVTEKVHGANFSFIYENKQLGFAKRKEVLQWSDDFFGFQEVAFRLENKVLNLFEELNSLYPGHKFQLYGELFGGAYPHPDIDPDPNVKAIQTGVYYAPGVHFCAFDISMENQSGERSYLDYESATKLFEKYEILHAVPLYSGKLTNALEFNTRINSTIPELLNLPQLPENLIEGVVIKPLNFKYQGGVKTRPIFKVKNTEFDEEKKFHEARKWSYIPDVTIQGQELNFILDEIRQYLNKNRLESALSKTGAIDPNNQERMAAILKELTEDTWTDFNLDNEGILDELSSEQNDWIAERVKADAKELIRTYSLGG